MQVHTTRSHLNADPPARELVNFLETNIEELELGHAEVYYDFPIFRDDEGTLVISRVLLASPNHGLILFETTELTARHGAQELRKTVASLDHLFSCVFSRLLRVRALKAGRLDLKVGLDGAIFAPNFNAKGEVNSQFTILHSLATLRAYLDKVQTPQQKEPFEVALSTIDGARGLISRARTVPEDLAEDSKGRAIAELEAEIRNFDAQQKHGYITVLEGPQRIRGLAGSGKTVVLAMKAAQTHLRYPDATIGYTFHTKSLHQHIRRLITRFYRQFDDRDPDWDHVQILHAWGGVNAPGIYYNACRFHGQRALSFSEAAAVAPRNEFDYVCSQLLESPRINPIYDYLFVDEGQDFPSSFLRLIQRLARKNRFVFAYDELQTIFQPTSPTLEEIFGIDHAGNPRISLSADIVLHKCYRNPREILVVAHAIGLGLYSEHIVQMLENREHWEDIGYEVLNGDFVEGEDVEIKRPAKHSLQSISKRGIEEIVKAASYAKYRVEIEEVIKAIREDLTEGLKPEDILVICVDDRHAKKYLQDVASCLEAEGIGANNMHRRTFGLRDFQQEDKVTLSTVHKAKGNESFMVYVIGVDALFPEPTIRQRNMLFTAMTRAKGWVRVSGIGLGADDCVAEIDAAKRNFPYLRFKYPSEEELSVMKRDLEAEEEERQIRDRKLDEVLEQYSPAELMEVLRKRQEKKKEAD